MRFKWYWQQWQENLHNTYHDGSIHNPMYSINIEARLKVTRNSSDYYSNKRFEWLLQWQCNTLKQLKTLYQATITVMMKHFMTAEDLCGHMWQSIFNHTNPFTFFAVNDYNHKHSVGLSQPTITAAHLHSTWWHVWQHGSRHSMLISGIWYTQEWQ